LAVSLVWGGALSACTVDLDEPSTAAVQQKGMQMQGMQMQGMQMQGMQMQGMQMQGFELGGATLSGVGLTNLHVDKGEVVATKDGITVRGTSLAGTHLFARVTDPTTQTTIDAEYRIASIQTEKPQYDPTHTGATYLYTLEQYVPDTQTWSNACGVDLDGFQYAIPVAATYDAHGDRHYTPDMFTFGCTNGVIAKCYRWGYRPWLTGYGGENMDDYHWACTRAARADYCGDGTPHTHDGTQIDVWDILPSPGPMQKRGGLLGILPPLGMVFEAGWDTQGAVCVSHQRWLLDGQLLANLCPDKLVPPGLLGATVCDTLAGVLGYDPDVKVLEDSYVNVNLLGVTIQL